MIKLKKLNVVRIVDSEDKKAKLISQGFIEVVEKAGLEAEKVIKSAESEIKKTTKTK